MALTVLALTTLAPVMLPYVPVVVILATVNVPEVVKLPAVMLPVVVIVAVVKYEATLVFEYVPVIPAKILVPLLPVWQHLRWQKFGTHQHWH